MLDLYTGCNTARDRGINSAPTSEMVFVGADCNPRSLALVGAEKTVWNSFSRKPSMGEAYGADIYSAILSPQAMSRNPPVACPGD